MLERAEGLTHQNPGYFRLLVRLSDISAINSRRVLVWETGNYKYDPNQSSFTRLRQFIADREAGSGGARKLTEGGKGEDDNCPKTPRKKRKEIRKNTV